MDQLASSTFRDDEPVAVSLVESTAGAGAASTPTAWIPERLFERMLHLGAGYHLHVLGVVQRDVDTSLNDRQCESLLSELEFLARLVPSDAALQRALAEIVPFVARTARSSGRANLLFQPP